MSEKNVLKQFILEATRQLREQPEDDEDAADAEDTGDEGGDDLDGGAEDAAAPEEPKVPAETGEDSVDAQVDRYLTQYESEAKHAKAEGMCFRSLTQRVLFEQDDEPDTGDKAATLDDIDIRSFVSDVMRLIENVDNLIEFKSTILRRALNFIGEAYDDEVVERMRMVVRDEYGAEAGKTEHDIESEISPPPAGRAGPLGGV